MRFLGFLLEKKRRSCRGRLVGSWVSMKSEELVLKGGFLRVIRDSLMERELKRVED